MNICEEGHEEIVIEGRRCPLCDALQEISNLEDKIRELETEEDNLKKDTQ